MVDLNLDKYVQDQDELGMSSSFKMSPLVEMDVHLQKDNHFQEMVQDVERFSSREYVEVWSRMMIYSRICSIAIESHSSLSFRCSLSLSIAGCKG